jgi:hypothetical protein
MHDYRPMTHSALGQAREDTVDLVERINFELRLDLTYGGQFEDVDQVGGMVMRRPYYGRLFEQHSNRIALNGLSTHSRCDQAAAWAQSLYGLTVLFHGRREGQDRINAAHIREFLPYVILDHKDVISSHGFSISLLVRRVGDSHNFVPHRLRYLQGEMTQAANPNYRDAITRLRFRGAICAHS